MDGVARSVTPGLNDTPYESRTPRPDLAQTTRCVPLTVWQHGKTPYQHHALRVGGRQVLWEMRAPGADGQDLENTGTGIFPSGQSHLFGRVSYLHAGGIDRPLTIWKEGVGSVRPHQNWRGLFWRGTWGYNSDGAVGTTANCVSTSMGYCLPLNWPGERTTAWHAPTGGESELWMGGLVDGMRDATGQVYMRNRYYNPQTGQFTQMDPIGIDGGLNAYGFAAGDPISYSDPFGLCPPVRSCMLHLFGGNITFGDIVHTLRHASVSNFSRRDRFIVITIFQTAREANRLFAEREGIYTGDQLNALYHQFGACTLARRLGPAEARAITEAHEQTLASKGDDEEADSRADGQNNEIGIAAGVNNEPGRPSCEDVADQNIWTENYATPNQ